MTRLNEQQAKEIGERVAELFFLKPNKKGEYETSWGSKTLVGLGRVIERIVREETEGGNNHD